MYGCVVLCVVLLCVHSAFSCKNGCCRSVITHRSMLRRHTPYYLSTQHHLNNPCLCVCVYCPCTHTGAVLEMCMALGQANLGVLKMLSDAHASK